MYFLVMLHHTQYQPPFRWGEIVPDFEKDRLRKKISAWGVGSLLQIFAWGGLLYFLWKKYFVIWGFNFQMSILASFSQTTSQCLVLWQFSFVKILELSELFICLVDLLCFSVSEGQKKKRGYGLQGGGDQYPGWHYVTARISEG